MLLSITIITAYLAGSIPSAVWIGRMVAGIDIREHGSGNMGATNLARVVGVRWAFVAAFVDIAKGFAPVFWLASFASIDSPFGIAEARLVLAAAAIIGHLYPVFASFRGGKGVLTATGAFLAVLPLDVAVALVVWVIVFSITRIVSLSSLSAATALVIAVLIRRFVFAVSVPDSLVAAVVLIAILVFFTHRSNIRRLLDGTEASFKRESE